MVTPVPCVVPLLVLVPLLMVVLLLSGTDAVSQRLSLSERIDTTVVGHARGRSNFDLIAQSDYAANRAVSRYLI